MEIRIGYSWNSLHPENIIPIFGNYDLIEKYYDFLVYKLNTSSDGIAGYFAACKPIDCEPYCSALAQADSLEKIKEKILKCLVV